CLVGSEMCIRDRSIVIQIVKDYIKYYNEKRIQQKLGYQSPINFRKQAA
ncbi:IS3 family transposase, partial [Listeria monocytogenes]